MSSRAEATERPTGSIIQVVKRERKWGIKNRKQRAAYKVKSGKGSAQNVCYRITYWSKEAFFCTRGSASHIFHIFIASSAGHRVNRRVPSPFRTLWPIALRWALVTVTTRLHDGNAWTAMELHNGASGRGTGWVEDARGSQEEPCVLNNSLQWGDQCSEVTEVCKGMVCSGFISNGAFEVELDGDSGLEDVAVRDFMLKILILPSG